MLSCRVDNTYTGDLMAIGDRISTNYDDFTFPANETGLEFYDLSIPWGHDVANLSLIHISEPTRPY